MKDCEQEEAIPDYPGEPPVIIPRVLRSESRELRVRREAKTEAEARVVQGRLADDRLPALRLEEGVMNQEIQVALQKMKKAQK